MFLGIGIGLMVAGVAVFFYGDMKPLSSPDHGLLGAFLFGIGMTLALLWTFRVIG